MSKDTKKRIDTVPTPRVSDGDVAVSAPVGESDEATAAAAGASARPATKVRRGPAARGLSAPTAPLLDVPRQPSASSPLVVSAPAVTPAAAARQRRVRTAVWFGAAATVVLALSTGSAVYASNAREQEAQDAALAASSRVDKSVAASARDAVLDRGADQAVAATALAANRARTAAQAQAAVDQANSVLAATPNAGDAPRAALGAASTAVAAAMAAPTTSAASLRKVAGGVAAPLQGAVDAQAAWQAAENARIAAEQAAAAAAQAQAAAAAAARSRQTSTPRASRSTASAPRATASGGAAAPAPAAAGVPSGGKVCTSAGGGAGESSVGAIGAAINAYRAGLGLPELSVSRSGGLVSHAVDMANAGGIWHSGSDNIVACVSSGSASAMVSAWSQSPGHDAQMRRTDVSSMGVGGASLDGWLYGAVKFS
ncbi:CAP domain-containing protein [Cellulomonas sp. URHE0023]|uniref:CAP domain-containing protein n=1 Tax=Cellulomonas sp. URHE0023 TaxID=1380354 RepID=UPI0004832CF6|nr:CAP domain-containing protein [Cellulomonas sp. URHE0023]